MITKGYILRATFLALVTIIAIVSIVRVFTKTGRPGFDFHSYWYPGHFIWQGADPYQSIFDGRVPRLPVYYWDGAAVTEGDVNQPDWRGLPANTAPVVLLLAPLSRLSWPVALKIWQVSNLALAVVAAWLVVKLLRGSPFSWKGWFVLTVFLSLIATRETIEYGQTSLLILVCMLAAWYLGDRYPIAAGLLLGMALSKYSLAFPIFLLFVYRRWFKGLLVGLLVQAAALLAISINGGTSPFEVMGSYLRILVNHASLPGMHLTAGILKDAGTLSYVVLVLGSAALFGILLRWYRLRKESQEGPNFLVEFNWVTIIMLWNILVFYHRRYDNVCNILLIALVVFCVRGRADSPRFGLSYSLSVNRRTGIYIAMALIGFVWILPVYLFMPDAFYIYLFNLANVAALILAVWLLFQPQPVASEAPPAELVDRSLYASSQVSGS